MTDFVLGTASAEFDITPTARRLAVSGRDTGAFNPNRRTWKWHDSLSGELDQLPVPVIQTATSISGEAAVLNALVDPRGLDTSVVFEYGTAVDTNGDPVFGHTSDAVNVGASFGSSLVSIPIDTLTADTLYYARADATNTNGTATSDFITFQTLVDGPTSGPPIVDSDPTVVGVPTQTAITIAASFDMNNAAGFIHLERLVGSTWTDIASPQSAPSGVQTMTATASGLVAGTTYQFRARATNPFAPEPNGTISSTLAAQTAPADPTLPVPSLLAAGTPGQTTITVNGRISSYTEVPVRWQFQYGLTTAYGSTSPLQIDSVVPPTGTEDVSANLSGLTAATTYHYRLVAMRVDNAGGNQFSADGTFTTASPPDPVLPVPALTPAGTLTSSSAVVNGQITNIVEVPVKYQFEYGTTTAYGSTTTLITDAVIPAGGTENVTATITGLSASTTYHYRLNATRTDDQGGAQHSSDGTFTTTSAAAAVLPVPSPKGPVIVGQTTATVLGNLAQITSQSNVSYHFEYGTTTSYGSSTSVGTTVPLGGVSGTVVNALVSGSVDPKGATLTLFVDYGTDPDNLSSSVQYGQISGTGAKSFSMVVDSLTPNTIYWFRARATNSGGTSVSTLRPTRLRTPLITPEVAYHISPTGNNTTGDGLTLATAWKTIQKVASTPGATTCLMHAGQYVGQTITSKPSQLLTIKDAGDGVVELDFVSIQSAGNLNFEGNIKATGYARPQNTSALIFEGFGTPTTKAGPVYWAAGVITILGHTKADVCVRASNDANNFYFDGTVFGGGGFSFKSFANTTPTTSYPTTWRFTGCEFTNNQWDLSHPGQTNDLVFIDCTEHDVVFNTGTGSTEHHDSQQIQNGTGIKWVGGRVYDHTNTINVGPGSATLLNNDTGGALSNVKIIAKVFESWPGAGINITNGDSLKILQCTSGNCPGSANTQGDTGSQNPSDLIVNTDPTHVTLRGNNFRSQYYASGASTEDAIDKNLWRTDSDRAGTNAKSGAVTFVSTTDLHLANGTQAAATGGPLPTDDADVLAWDNEGRGYGSDPAIGAYASPLVTSPLFSGMVTATGLTPEAQTPSVGLTSLSAGTLYHYRLSAVRVDGSGGTQNSTDAVFTTQSATLVTTPAAYGPQTAVSTTSTVSGGTFVVKSDGKIYDSTGTTLQDFTSKAFNSLVTLKSDTAGTRRTLNSGLLNNSQYQAGLILRELTFNDPTANFEVKDPSTTIGLDFQGCSGRLGHFRVVNFAHHGIGLSASSAPVTTGAVTTTWDTTIRDSSIAPGDLAKYLRLDNCSAHAAGGADGSSVKATSARNVILGGFAPGTQASPIGLSGPAFLFDGSGLDDVQDVVVGVALDGTTSIVGSTSGTYTFHVLHARRSGWQGKLDTPVLFTNTTGSRPEKPIWMGSTDGASPGSETSSNTTNAKVVCDNPRTRDGIAQNLVTYSFLNGATGNQAFEVDATVWDPAVPLTMWATTLLEQPTAVRFIDPKTGLGARPTGATPPALVNNSTIDSTFTLGGATGSVGRAGDGWFEIRGVKFDPGTVASPIWTDGTGNQGALFKTDNTKGAQVTVLPSGGSYTIPALPLFTGSTSGGVTLKVQKPGGGTPDLSKWVKTPATGSGELVLGIYTNRNDPNLGSTAVDANYGYRRQLGYTGVDTVAGAFTGVFLIPGPSGGAINPDPGVVLSVTAATPGVVTTEYPHGLATNDWVDIAGNSQPSANGTFKVTRVTNRTFSLQTTAGVNVAISSAGTGGTYTPRGPSGGGYTYGLTGAATTLTLTAGDTLDSTQNSNFGQPRHNAQLQVGTDTTGIRFIGCDFFDVCIDAHDVDRKIEFVDCQMYATDLPGQGIDYDTVDNGVRGTYDSSNQHWPDRMIGELNMIGAAEAFWTIERSLFHNAHGDIMPGRFQPGSVIRHCRTHHARDCNNTSITGSITRDGIGTGLPKVAQGPHGDQFQNYERNSITAIGNDLHSDGNNSIWFSQSQTHYAVYNVGGQGDPITITSDGGTPAKIVVKISHKTTDPGPPAKYATFHNFNDRDTLRIDGSGDPALDGHEFTVLDAKEELITIDQPYAANRSGFTVTHAIHQTADWRRNDLRVSRNFNRSDLTESTSLTGKGNKTFNETNPAIANLVTMVTKFYDNRWERGEVIASGWHLPTPLAGTSHDYGTPNRNLYRNYSDIDSVVPGQVATPKLS